MLDIQDINEKLLDILLKKRSISSVFKAFTELETNTERVHFAGELLEKYDLYPKLVEDGKNNEESTKLRKAGNELFKNRQFAKALESYTKCIALAEDNSECAALAYANRSAVLYEKKLYTECLKDIERAFMNNYPKNLMDKLLRRQENANTLKQNSKAVPHHEEIPQIPADVKNDTLQCWANSVVMRRNEDFGRHMIATRDIQIGEILAVEKAFCTVLISSKLIHCHECLALCYCTIPCDICTQVMYCDEKCKNSAWNKYHKFECPILKTVNMLNSHMEIIAVKIAMSVKHLYEDIDNLNLDEGTLYRSDRYVEIHNLVTNTEKRSPLDLFPRAVQAAILYNLVKKHSTFFKEPVTDNDANIFSGLVLHHIQTYASSFYEIGELAVDPDNGILCSDDEMDDGIASGAFASTSLISHACNPNVFQTYYGTTIVLRATEFIPKGGQLYINYGCHYSSMNKEARQKHLNSQYYFICKCKACEEDWPTECQLPRFGTLQCLSISDRIGLIKGNIETAKKVLQECIPKARGKWIIPSLEWFDLDEAIKQSYCILGNRRYF